MFKHYVESLTGPEMWRAAKFAIILATSIVEALTDGIWKHTNMIAQNEEMLSRQSFPPKEYNQHFEIPPA